MDSFNRGKEVSESFVVIPATARKSPFAKG